MMTGAIRELRDPYGWGLAALVLVANLLLRAGPLKSGIVTLIVLAVKATAGMLWPRRVSVSEPTPAQQVPSLVDRVPGSRLTSRELEVAHWTPHGLSNKEIGKKLVPPVKERGVEKHISNIMVKLDVRTRAEIAAWYTRQTPSSQPK